MERVPGTSWIGGGMDLRLGLNAEVDKRKTHVQDRNRAPVVHLMEID
jgi:hypothetical protein